MEGFVPAVEAAKIIGINRGTLFRWIDRGEVKAYRDNVTKRVYVHKDDLTKFQSSERMSPITPKTPIVVKPSPEPAPAAAPPKDKK